MSSGEVGEGVGPVLPPEIIEIGQGPTIAPPELTGPADTLQEITEDAEKMLIAAMMGLPPPQMTEVQFKEKFGKVADALANAPNKVVTQMLDKWLEQLYKLAEENRKADEKTKLRGEDIRGDLWRQLKAEVDATSKQLMGQIVKATSLYLVMNWQRFDGVSKAGITTGAASTYAQFVAYVLRSAFDEEGTHAENLKDYAENRVRSQRPDISDEEVKIFVNKWVATMQVTMAFSAIGMVSRASSAAGTEETLLQRPDNDTEKAIKTHFYDAKNALIALGMTEKDFDDLIEQLEQHNRRAPVGVYSLPAMAVSFVGMMIQSKSPDGVDTGDKPV